VALTAFARHNIDARTQWEDAVPLWHDLPWHSQFKLYHYPKRPRHQTDNPKSPDFCHEAAPETLRPPSKWVRFGKRTHLVFFVAFGTSCMAVRTYIVCRGVCKWVRFVEWHISFKYAFVKNGRVTPKPLRGSGSLPCQRTLLIIRRWNRPVQLKISRSDSRGMSRCGHEALFLLKVAINFQGYCVVHHIGVVSAANSKATG
jgi:hypothetical protein